MAHAVQESGRFTPSWSPEIWYEGYDPQVHEYRIYLTEAILKTAVKAVHDKIAAACPKFANLSTCDFFGEARGLVYLPLLGDGMGVATSRNCVVDGVVKEIHNTDISLRETLCFLRIFKKEVIAENPRERALDSELREVTLIFPGDDISRMEYDHSILKFGESITTPSLSADFRARGDARLGWQNLFFGEGFTWGIHLVNGWKNPGLVTFLTQHIEEKVYNFDRIAVDWFIPKSTLYEGDIRENISPLDLPEGLAFLRWFLTDLEASQHIPEESITGGFHLVAEDGSVLFMSISRSYSRPKRRDIDRIQGGWCQKAYYGSNSYRTLLYSKV